MHRCCCQLWKSQKGENRHPRFSRVAIFIATFGCLIKNFWKHRQTSKRKPSRRLFAHLFCENSPKLCCKSGRFCAHRCCCQLWKSQKGENRHPRFSRIAIFIATFGCLIKNFWKQRQNIKEKTITPSFCTPLLRKLTETL